MGVAIETKKLTKTYKSRLAGKVNVVDNLDLVVEEGEIFGFLGPNGAGKTTTIKMLLGIIYPTEGEGYVLGKEIGDMDVHRVISYLPERPYYYEHMTGMELYERLRADGSPLANRIVFMTGGAFSPDSADFVSTCERPILEKPVDRTSLAKAMAFARD